MSADASMMAGAWRDEVAAYYGEKTERILRRYGPGTRCARYLPRAEWLRRVGRGARLPGR